MRAYRIERGVPLPREKRVSKYPLDKLEVGGSFSVPIPPGHPPEVIKARVASAIQWFKKHDAARSFTLRVVQGSVRVWRTA